MENGSKPEIRQTGSGGGPNLTMLFFFDFLTGSGGGAAAFRRWPEAVAPPRIVVQDYSWLKICIFRLWEIKAQNDLEGVFL